MNEVGCTLSGRSKAKDCADANAVELNDILEPAQLQPTAAGLERSAAHPASGDQSPQ
jgi:hypothetical protein